MRAQLIAIMGVLLYAGCTGPVADQSDYDSVSQVISGKPFNVMLTAYSTTLIANGKDQALEIARNYPEKIHLLLTDVVMPDMNGKELADRIQKVKPELRCLYMSGYTSDIIARQGILEEGVKFISKPFSVQDLATKIREVLG